MSGGVYNIPCFVLSKRWHYYVSRGNSGHRQSGISVSSLERVIVCHRPTASIIAAGSYSLGHRIKNGLTQYSIFVNGEQYPARPVVVEDKCAEALAEFLLATTRLSTSTNNRLLTSL